MLGIAIVVGSELLENIGKVKDYLTSSDPTLLFVEADTQAILRLFPDNCLDCVYHFEVFFIAAKIATRTAKGIAEPSLES